MTKDAYQQTYSAVRQNLIRLSSIRAVALLGQIVALIYFTQISPIGLPATAIAVVLAVYASVTAATWQRSRMQVPITDNEFFTICSPIYCSFPCCCILAVAHQIRLFPII